MSRSRNMGAGLAGTSSYRVNTSIEQVGDTLQGLAPLATGYYRGHSLGSRYRNNTFTTKRDYIFSVNQNGGVGRTRSQFKNTSSKNFGLNKQNGYKYGFNRITIEMISNALKSIVFFGKLYKKNAYYVYASYDIIKILNERNATPEDLYNFGFKLAHIEKYRDLPENEIRNILLIDRDFNKTKIYRFETIKMLQGNDAYIYHPLVISTLETINALRK